MTGSKALYGGKRKSRSNRRRNMRGGVNAPNPSSYSDTSSWGMAVHGSGPSQYDRTFQGSDSAIYKGVQGQSAGGKRTKKGGFWGQVINQALVPFSIFGMQQTYRRGKHGGSKHGGKHGGKNTKKRR